MSNASKRCWKCESWSLQCKELPPEPERCLCWDKQKASRWQNAKFDVQFFGEEVQWRVLLSACFLTKAKPKRPECCGEEGSCSTPLQVPCCWDDSSQLCHTVAWVILSLTDSIPASRPGSGRTHVTSWMCLALLAADFFSSWFCCCFFSPKVCSVVWSFPSLLPSIFSYHHMNFSSVFSSADHIFLCIRTYYFWGREGQVSNKL